MAGMPPSAAPQQRRGAQPPPAAAAAEQPSAVDGTLLTALRRVMKQHWGPAAEFRTGQAEAVAATLAGRDCLVILPTGGGKSLTFQLAPLYRNQISVVVAPLLALAKDQVNGCLERGIEAASWSSETPENVKAMLGRELLADPEDTTLRLLYTTPESLGTERLRELLKTAHEYGKLCSLAIDEAHCMSEWGHDFRPAYLQLGELRAEFPGLPLLAATATATSNVQKSVIGCLRLRDPLLLRGSLNRPNLAFEVRHKELLGDGGREAAVQDLLAFLAQRRGQSGIIYARLRATCDWLAGRLGDEDIDCAAYHAAKDAQQRAKIQAGWSEGDYECVVSTIAFGMGIDKADVRYVVHFDPPASMEGLYQEAGRGGRDGQPAACVVYASNEELKEAKRMERGARQGAVGAVAAYIQEPRCRRRALLSFFGEKRGGGCGAEAGEQACDYCRDPKAVLGALARLGGELEARAAAEAEAAQRSASRDGGGSDGDDEEGAGGSGSEEGSREAGAKPGRGPFSTARSLQVRPPAAGAARPALGARTAGGLAPRSAPQAYSAPHTLPPRPGGASAAAAGAAAPAVQPARQPLRPLLPNRPKRPLAEVSPAAKQQQQQQQQQLGPAGQPASPQAASPAAGGGAAAAAGGGSGAGALQGGALKRRPQFKPFKPPRRAET